MGTLDILKSQIIINAVVALGLLMGVIIVSPAVVVEAEFSPSFDNQQIDDSLNDWTIYDINKTKDISKCKNNNGNFLYPDIKGVDLVSDGTTLNSTMWMGSQVKRPDENVSYLEYETLLDVVSTYDLDYDFYLSYIWNETNKSWTREIGNLRSAPAGFIRPIIIQEGYARFEDGHDYINMSLDLGLVNYPEQYVVGWTNYIEYTNGSTKCDLVDHVNWVSLPPPKYNMTISPSSIEIRPGEEKSVLITIQSGANLETDIQLWADNSKDLKLTFNPENITVPLSGSGGSSLEIEPTVTLDEQKTSQISINGEATLITTTPSGKINSAPITINSDKLLEITIMPPLSPQEYLKNVIDLWVTPLAPIWSFLGGVTVVLVPVIARWYDKRRKRSLGNEQPHNDTE
jgi:hypothetical protein